MTRFVSPVFQALSKTGTPLPGAELTVFDTGTTTKKRLYLDDAETVETSNPVVANGAGIFPLFFYSGTAKQVLKSVRKDPETGTKIRVLQWERDPVFELAQQQDVESLVDVTTTIINNSNTIAVGETVTTRGYSTQGDGGAGLWRKTGNTGTPSQDPVQYGAGGITDADGAVWELVSVHLNVLMYGAVRNVQTDTQPQIQQMLDDFVGREVYMPKGEYYVANTVWVKKHGQWLIGESLGTYIFNGQRKDGTSLIWFGSDGGTLCQFYVDDNTTSPFSLSGGGLKNLQFFCPGPNGEADTGLFIPDCNGCRFESLKVDGGRNFSLDLTAFVPDITGLNSVFNCSFDNIALWASTSGIAFNIGETPNPGGGDHPAFVSFNNTRITYENGTGLNMDEGDDLAFTTLGLARREGGTADAAVLTTLAQGNHFRNVNAGFPDGTAPRIIDNGTNNYWELSGIDTNIKPEAGPENFFMYTGTQTDPNSADSKLPVIKLPNKSIGGNFKLDWYESGDLNIVLTIGGSGAGITYANRSGRFTRIGNQVFMQIQITLTSKGTNTGNLQVNALPYRSSSVNRTYSAFRQVSNFAAGINDAGSQIGIGTFNLDLVKSTGSGGSVPMTDADISNDSDWIMTTQYEAQ